MACSLTALEHGLVLVSWYGAADPGLPCLIAAHHRPVNAGTGLGRPVVARAYSWRFIGTETLDLLLPSPTPNGRRCRPRVAALRQRATILASPLRERPAFTLRLTAFRPDCGGERTFAVAEQVRFHAGGGVAKAGRSRAEVRKNAAVRGNRRPALLADGDASTRAEAVELMGQLEAEMKAAAAELRYEEAALLRDEIADLRAAIPG